MNEWRTNERTSGWTDGRMDGWMFSMFGSRWVCSSTFLRFLKWPPEALRTVIRCTRCIVGETPNNIIGQIRNFCRGWGVAGQFTRHSRPRNVYLRPVDECTLGLWFASVPHRLSTLRPSPHVCRSRPQCGIFCWGRSASNGSSSGPRFLFGCPGIFCNLFVLCFMAYILCHILLSFHIYTIDVFVIICCIAPGDVFCSVQFVVFYIICDMLLVGHLEVSFGIVLWNFWHFII